MSIRRLQFLFTASLEGTRLVWSRNKKYPDRRQSSVDPESLQFPPGFMFGTATAAHQVEGGTTNNNWIWWEQQLRPDGTKTIRTGDRCGRASDHWTRFDEDLDRMRDLGLSMYRFSIEWSRIEPEAGRFDAGVLERYRSWCEKLRGAGITPMVTLHHFTDPLWFTQQGGFERPEAVDMFVRFVRYVVPRLADVVDHWVTINEPLVYCLLGWGNGEFPPGKRDLDLMARVLDHVLTAHAGAYHALHELDRMDADGDGIACLAAPASNIVLFEPHRRWSPFDQYLAQVFDHTYNRAALDALETGLFRIQVPGIVEYESFHPQLAGTWDFAAVNHYFRILAGLRWPFDLESLVRFDPTAEKNDMGWDLTPHSLYHTLHFMAE